MAGSAENVYQEVLTGTRFKRPRAVSEGVSLQLRTIESRYRRKPGVFVDLAKRLLPKLLMGVLLALACAPLALGQKIEADKLRESLKYELGVDIYDHAKLLDAETKAKLEEVCRGVRKEKRGQLVVVTLPELKGGEVHDFATKLFKQWGIGDKELDNGALLLIAMNERAFWLETGYGTEGILPDGMAKRILNKELVPRFKEKKYQEGIDAAVRKVAEVMIKGEPAPKDEEMTWKERAVIAMFLSIFVGLGGLFFGAGIGGRQAALILVGLPFMILPFLMGAMFLFPFSPIFHTIVAIPAMALGWAINRNGGWTKGQGGGGRWGGGPTVIPWDWGGLGGGSSFGGGSSGWSGGGFSSDWGGFGGGSSGGGGAGGSW
jgi:uncharacterized protein